MLVLFFKMPLSQQEIGQLLDTGQGGMYPLFRKCALAVLNAGSTIDDARVIFEKYRDFDLRIVRQAWGIKLEIHNAPAAAFVDGEMIRLRVDNEVVEIRFSDIRTSRLMVSDTLLKKGKN